MAPLLPYVLAYAGGIALALPAADDFLPFHLLPLLMFVTSAALGFGKGRRSVLAWVMWLALPVLGAWNTLELPNDDREYILNQLQEGQPAELVGELDAAPLTYPDRTVYVLNLRHIRYDNGAGNVAGRARITLYAPAPPRFAVGDVLHIEKVKLKRPRNFKNPGRFDYRGYLATQGIDVMGGMSKPGDIEKQGEFQPSIGTRFRNDLLRRLLAPVDAHLPGDTGALLKAMVLGKKESLAEDILEAYRVTGLAHLMAVSGLHIGFVAGASFLAFRSLVFRMAWRWAPDLARSGATRVITALLCMVPVSLYLVLVGDKVSALRAGIMVFMILLAVLLNRQRNLFNALAAAALAILLWHPRALVDPGFQMSFLAVGFILFTAQRLALLDSDPIDRMGESKGLRHFLLGLPPSPNPEDWLPRDRLWVRVRAFVAGTFIVTLAATVGTLPALVYHFHRISVVGLALNLLLVPLASLAIPLALLLMTLSALVPALGAVLLFPVDVLFGVFLWIPRFFAGLPHMAAYVPSPPRIWIFLYGALWVGILIRLTWDPPRETKDLRLRRWMLNGGLAAAAGAVALLMLWPRFPERATDQLTVAVLDVGQGESIFIEFPNRQVMMVDGGGFYKDSLNIGRSVVAPFLWHRGIRTLDFMAATHSDQDHISGLESLLDLFPLRHFLDPYSGNPKAMGRRMIHLRDKALARDADAIPLRAGQALRIGEVILTPLHPDPDFLAGKTAPLQSRERNEFSLVFRLDYREFSILLTGDIGQEAEDYLLERGAPLNALFLQGPHHGSRYSNSLPFIRAVHPRAVLFSSGYLNWNRHPHPEILSRYRKEGAHTYRTDLEGAIVVTTDGYRHRVETHPDL